MSDDRIPDRRTRRGRAVKIGEIRIEVTVREDGGDVIGTLFVDGNLGVVEVLGHLRMAEDTVLSDEYWEDDDE